jgi:NAD(P)-dependent dehydrogenase (short-subunit alcohol dehydrogenase family)
LAGRGADIVLADIHDRRLADVELEIKRLGQRVCAVHCDVARESDVLHLAQVAEAQLGPVGIVMNNAGVVLRGALEQIDMPDWHWCFGIDVFGPIHGIRAFLPGMLERHHGWIINTGSMAGLVPLTGEGAPYIAAKFAVVGLTEALALYARPFGVGVSLVCPGGVNTNLAETGRSIGMTPERERAETRAAQAVQGGEELDPATVGELVAQAVLNEQYLVLPEPASAAVVRRRGEDIGAWVESRLRGLEPLA